MIQRKDNSHACNLTRTAITGFVLAASFSGGINAAELYNKDGLVYQLKTDWQIQLKQDLGDDQNLDVEYDDLELKNIVEYDLGNGVKAFGRLDLSFNVAADNEERDGANRLEEAFLGFKFDGQRILIGKTDTAGDEFGVEKAYEKVGLAEDGFEEIADRGDDLIRTDLHFGDIYLAISTELEAEGEGSTDDSSLVDVFISYEFSDINLAAAYMDFQEGPSADSIEVVGVSATYGSFGFDFSSIDNVEGADDLDIFNVVGAFNFASDYRWRFGLVDEDSDNDADDASGWYTNLTYKFPNQKKVRIFTEIGDNDKDNVDLGFLVGMQVVM